MHKPRTLVCCIALVARAEHKTLPTRVRRRCNSRKFGNLKFNQHQKLRANRRLCRHLDLRLCLTSGHCHSPNNHSECRLCVLIAYAA